MRLQGEDAFSGHLLSCGRGLEFIDLVTNPLFHEREKLFDHLSALTTGTSSPGLITETTPNNRRVSFQVKTGENSWGISGRIGGVIQNPAGDYQVLILEQQSRGDYSQVPLSDIDLDSLLISKIPSASEVADARTKLEEAANDGLGISYVRQALDLSLESGKVLSLTTDEEGQIVGFLQLENSGMSVYQSISGLDPSSIVLFSIRPRSLEKSESIRATQLQRSYENETKLNMKIGNEIHFRGRVTKIEIGSDGEYLYAFKNEAGKGPLPRMIRLSEISLEF